MSFSSQGRIQLLSKSFFYLVKGVLFQLGVCPTSIEKGVQWSPQNSPMIKCWLLPSLVSSLAEATLSQREHVLRDRRAVRDLVYVIVAVPQNVDALGCGRGSNIV